MDLSAARVAITSAFQGEKLLLFGMFDPPGEVVVVVQGPPARETVMRKERFIGLWLNTGRQAFDDVPAYYYIAASQPLQRLLARGTGGEILSLADRLSSVRSVGTREDSDLTRFRLGLTDVKRREGLYPADIGQVTIQANRLFRVDLPFPSRLPRGATTCGLIFCATARSSLPSRARCRWPRWASMPNWPDGRTARVSFTDWAPSSWPCWSVGSAAP